MRNMAVLRNIISTLFMQIITILCSFIIPSALIKTYGSNVNGLVTSITQFLAYITLLESGIGPVLKSVLYKPIAEKKKEEIEKILSSSEKFFKMISYIFIGYIVILCIIFTIMMNKQFDIFFTLSLVIIIAISTFAEYYFGITYRLYLQAEQKTYIVSNIQMVTTMINAAFVIILIKFGASIQIVKLASSMIFVLRPLLQNIYVKKKYHINLKNVEGNYKLKQKWDGLAQHIASVIHENTDVTILTIFGDIKEVSVYSVYILVIHGIKKIVTALTSGIDDFFGNLLAKKQMKQLNKFLLAYELVYFTIITIMFSCTLILILPFVNVYVEGVTDVSYYRPAFAYIMVLAEFICLIRMPYVQLTYAAGHFKETSKGAWISAFTNIIISIALVGKLGMIGVAIGTFCAMLIRTIEFIYHASKKILQKSVIKPFMRVLITIVQIGFIVIIFRNKNVMEINSYIEWVIYASKVFLVSTIIISVSNLILYRKRVKEVLNILKMLINNKYKQKNIKGEI